MALYSVCSTVLQMALHSVYLTVVQMALHLVCLTVVLMDFYSGRRLEEDHSQTPEDSQTEGVRARRIERPVAE